MTKTLDSEIKFVKAFIAYWEKGYGKKQCKDYNPDCPNCQSMVTLGGLRQHLELLEWERDSEKKEDGVK